MKLSLLLLILLVPGLLLAGCVGQTGKGLLQGKVTIGPISPVEQPEKNDTISCEVYDARKIMIYDENRKKLIHQVDIDCNSKENNATYSIELEPGIYTVDINHIGIDYSKDVPEQVKIKAGITTRLDIDIDTGIR